MMKLSLSRKLLENRAFAGKTMTYIEFANATGVIKAPVIGKCTRILEELIRQDIKDSRPILAAMVVQKGLVGIPRRGFFELLADLSDYHGDSVGIGAQKWHQQELEKLKIYYHKQG